MVIPASVLHVPWLMPSGYLAVDLFFLMSGFVIAHSYELRLPEMGIKKFMLFRIIRLGPLFYLGGLLGLLRLFLLGLTGHPDIGPLGVVPYFFFLPAVPGASPNDVITPLNGPGWSLLLEIYVNLAYCILLPVLRTRTILLGTIVFGAALSISLATGRSGGPRWSELDQSLLRVVFSFGCGVLLYRMRSRIKFGNASTLPVLAAATLALMMPFSKVWDAVFVLFISPMLVITCLRCGRQRFIARYGASSSYCIYAIHVPLLLMATGTARSLGFDDRLAAFSIIIGVLVAAPFIDRFIDAPARARLNRWIFPRNSRASGTMSNDVRDQSVKGVTRTDLPSDRSKGERLWER